MNFTTVAALNIDRCERPAACVSDVPFAGAQGTVEVAVGAVEPFELPGGGIVQKTLAEKILGW